MILYILNEIFEVIMWFYLWAKEQQVTLEISDGYLQIYVYSYIINNYNLFKLCEV